MHVIRCVSCRNMCMGNTTSAACACRHTPQMGAAHRVPAVQPGVAGHGAPACGSAVAGRPRAVPPAGAQDLRPAAGRLVRIRVVQRAEPCTAAQPAMMSSVAHHASQQPVSRGPQPHFQPLSFCRLSMHSRFHLCSCTDGNGPRSSRTQCRTAVRCCKHLQRLRLRIHPLHEGAPVQT